TPRAIYFNDEVSAGYVQNGDLLEFTALDSKKGVFLYVMDAEKSDKPRLARSGDCLRCHQGPITLGVPGLIVSSVHPVTEGRDSPGGSFMTDHRIPLDGRWGGWLVSGTTGSQYHLGNNPALTDPLHPGGPQRDGTQNITDLSTLINTSRYLAPTSDIVALMTLEHQVRMTNLLIRVGWDARILEKDGKLDDRDLDS